MTLQRTRWAAKFAQKKDISITTMRTIRPLPLPNEIFLCIEVFLQWKDLRSLRESSTQMAGLFKSRLLDYKILHMLIHRRRESHILRELKRSALVGYPARGVHDITAMHCAAWFGYIGVLQSLLGNKNYKRQIDACDSHHYNTPAILAARFCQQKSLEVLLFMGANVNKRNSLGQSPLYWAITTGNVHSTRAIIQSGGDPNEEGYNGLTPLICTIFATDPKLALALLDEGADIECHGVLGITPLSWSVLLGLAPMAQFLLDQGANASQTVTESDAPHPVPRTSLMWAILTRNPTMVRLLLQSSANMNVSGGELSPLIWAIHLREEAIVQALVENGADVLVPDEYGLAPLDWAIGTQCRRIVRLVARAISL